MNKYTLPTSLEINGKEVGIDADYRNILDILAIFNDPNLLEQEKVYLALTYFYTDDGYLDNIEEASIKMVEFIDMEEYCTNTVPQAPQKPLYDWEQDFNIIISPINHILGYDVRGKEFLHWWTFMGAFMEIGESTFSTFVGIRDKLNRGVRLEKHEEKIYKQNKDKIRLKDKLDDVTQSLIDEIMGKE